MLLQVHEKIDDLKDYKVGNQRMALQIGGLAFKYREIIRIYANAIKTPVFVLSAYWIIMDVSGSLVKMIGQEFTSPHNWNAKSAMKRNTQNFMQWRTCPT